MTISGEMGLCFECQCQISEDKLGDRIVLSFAQKALERDDYCHAHECFFWPSEEQMFDQAWDLCQVWDRNRGSLQAIRHDVIGMTSMIGFRTSPLAHMINLFWPEGSENWQPTAITVPVSPLLQYPMVSSLNKLESLAYWNVGKILQKFEMESFKLAIPYVSSNRQSEFGKFVNFDIATRLTRQFESTRNMFLAASRAGMKSSPKVLPEAVEEFFNHQTRPNPPQPGVPSVPPVVAAPWQGRPWTREPGAWGGGGSGGGGAAAPGASPPAPPRTFCASII